MISTIHVDQCFFKILVKNINSQRKWTRNIHRAAASQFSLNRPLKFVRIRRKFEWAKAQDVLYVMQINYFITWFYLTNNHIIVFEFKIDLHMSLGYFCVIIVDFIYIHKKFCISNHQFKHKINILMCKSESI